MQKKGELSKLAKILLIGSLIVILAIVIWFIIRGGKENQNTFDDSTLDLKISEVKKIDDSKLNITVKRNSGEGEFTGLSFTVSDGATTEVIKVESSIPENQNGNFVLNFLVINASRVEKISVSPIFQDKKGEEIIGTTKDEYLSPACSPSCPYGAQCGNNGCGGSCGNGCNSGYLCVDHKCIKQQSSSGGGGGGSSSDDESGEDEIVDNENETVCVPTTCSTLSRTCGTVSNGCTGTLNCGTCLTGEICAVNGTCIKEVLIDCGDVSCKSGEYCSNGVCLLTVPGDTYFVALNGNDNNPGTFEQPFYSWQRGVQATQPGDIVYIRGGVWMPTTHIMSGSYNTGGVAMGITTSGTRDAPIRYYNYPGEAPIIDASLLSPNPDRWMSGISLDHVEYIYFKGLTVRNIHQTPPDFTHAKPYSEVFGIGASYSANLRYENMVVHDIDGRAFQHWSGAWNDFDGPGAVYDYDNTTWINCDAYNLYDRYSLTPGNAADGWKVDTYYGNYYTWEGCRAFNYSDDGFDPHGSGYRIFKNCWAMSTDQYEGLSEAWDSEGNGFKTTGIGNFPGYVPGKEKFVRFENSIAADCAGTGFVSNLLMDTIDSVPSNSVVYNNLAYKTYGNFWDSSPNIGSYTRTGIYRNNIAYKSTYDGQGYSPLYEVGIYNPAIYTHSNNTWRSTPSESWPGWEYNPAYSVTDADFISLDTSQLARPRKADFSLPDITFGHLRQGSDLIDGGTVIPGYHCSTAGAHPGENCREWYGAAPDLGPFESNY